MYERRQFICPDCGDICDDIGNGQAECQSCGAVHEDIEDLEEY